MRGMSALSELEIRGMVDGLGLRDRALVLLGVRSGFRISELLSLTLADFAGGRVSVARRSMKGKSSGRSVVLHPEAAAAVAEWVEVMRESGYMTQDCFVFQSRKGSNRPISRCSAWAILKAASLRAGVSGRVGTHSLRKTFAKGVYERTNKNLGLTQKALGHASINSTVQYLSFADSEVEAAILGA